MDKEIYKKLLEYLLTTPKALAVLIASFFSGHLWSYILAAYVRKSTKGSPIMNSKTGRTSIGFVWFVGILVPIYVAVYRDLSFEYEKILHIVLPTIVLGLFVQFLIVILFFYFGEPK